MTNLPSFPNEHNQPLFNSPSQRHVKKFTSSAYLDIDFNKFLKFDDSAYPHNKFGKKVFLRKGEKLYINQYNQKLSELSKMTWGQLLTSQSIRKHFKRIKYDSATSNIPALFFEENDVSVDVVGIFKFSSARRFGGVLDGSGTFYVFWIEHKDNCLYPHI